MLKSRTLPECNYRAVYWNGRTLRIALDQSKPITTLNYPEFYDVKVTSNCLGACPYCYQSSCSTSQHTLGIVDRFVNYFKFFTKNQMPFQIAFGGGEPTSHPEFTALLQACVDLNMVPNYTTNGMLLTDEVMNVTRRIVGGVAVSCHPHLEKYWREAVKKLEGVHTNLHIIIGDNASIDKFVDIYNEFSGRIKYFVLLPLSAQGRSRESFNEDGWNYLCSKVDGSPADIAFGANFHQYLEKSKGRFNVSLYDPEGMSAYLDLETMKVWKSSFSDEQRIIG